MFAQCGYTSPGRRPPCRASAQRKPTAWPEPDRISIILAYLPGFVKGVKEVKHLTDLDVVLALRTSGPSGRRRPALERGGEDQEAEHPAKPEQGGKKTGPNRRQNQP